MNSNYNIYFQHQHINNVNEKKNIFFINNFEFLVKEQLNKLLSKGCFLIDINTKKTI